MHSVLIMACLLTQVDAPKAAPAVRGAPVLTKVPDAYDAAVWALEDALALRANQQSAKHCLYLWIGPDAGPEVAKINSLAVNSSLSHSSTIQLPELTAGGRLIRWDLRKLAPKPDDFHRLVGVVNDLAFGEPYWNIDRSALGLPPAPTTVPYLWLDGKVYHKASVQPTPVTAESYHLLQKETGLLAPLMRADYFLRRISSTIQNGRYYHARGFITTETDAKGKVTEKRLNETQILDRLGVSAELSRRLGGDDRVGMVRSNVTGQARSVEYIQGVLGPVRMTYDRFSDNEKIDGHPLYSLLKVVERSDGKESIAELPNGLLLYWLTDGKGVLADEAPNKLVTDHRTPSPHPAQLYPMFSCVRCHGPNGGVQPTPNDVQRLLKTPGDLDAFADLGGTGFTAEDIDRLASLYGGDFEGRARDARNRYADACFKATRGLTAEKAAGSFASQYEGYWNDTVDAQRQLLELGWKVRSPQAANVALKTLLEKTEVDAFVDGRKITLEDPLIVAPRLGIPIRRQDQERIFAESFRRAYSHRNEVN
jgi:hypothetical protein